VPEIIFHSLFPYSFRKTENKIILHCLREADVFLYYVGYVFQELFNCRYAELPLLNQFCSSLSKGLLISVILLEVTIV
jgi:hypothetical protein